MYCLLIKWIYKGESDRMIILLVFLIGVIIVLSLLLLKILIDLKAINQQAKVKLETDTNFTITSDIQLKELRLLCENLNLMYDKYSFANKDKSKSEKEFKEMLSYIAHDVRTPLTSAQGYMQLLYEQDKTLENKRYYEIVNVRLNDVKNILEQFFLYSKLINDDYKLKKSKCYIYEICCQSIANFYQQLKTQGMEPKIEFEQRMVMVYANQELLTKVFDNLLSNALKHGIDDLKIVQNKNEITVSNSMKKSTELDLDKVFERFYKADGSRSNISSGLGLTIVQKVIHLMGGDITADIENNIFSIRIKLVETKYDS